MKKYFISLILLAVFGFAAHAAMSVIDSRTALSNWADLTTPAATQAYPLGLTIEVYNDSNKALQKYQYVKSHAALTQYQPYVVSYSSVAGKEVVTAAPATLAAPGSLVCLPQVAFTANYYGFVLIEGDGKALTMAETYAAGDHFQVINSSTNIAVDGTSGSTSLSVNSCGIFKESGSTATSRNVYLLGKRAVITAS